MTLRKGGSSQRTLSETYDEVENAQRQITLEKKIKADRAKDKKIKVLERQASNMQKGSLMLLTLIIEVALVTR